MACCRRVLCRINKATIKASRSAVGKLSQTPFRPMKRGRTSRAGIRNISCRESERKIAMPALPMDWK